MLVLAYVLNKWSLTFWASIPIQENKMIQWSIQDAQKYLRWRALQQELTGKTGYLVLLNSSS